MPTLAFHTPPLFVDSNYTLAHLYYISEIAQTYYIFGIKRPQTN